MYLNLYWCELFLNILINIKFCILNSTSKSRTRATEASLLFPPSGGGRGGTRGGFSVFFFFSLFFFLFYFSLFSFKRRTGGEAVSFIHVHIILQQCTWGRFSGSLESWRSTLGSVAQDRQSRHRQMVMLWFLIIYWMSSQTSKPHGGLTLKDNSEESRLLRRSCRCNPKCPKLRKTLAPQVWHSNQSPELLPLELSLSPELLVVTFYQSRTFSHNTLICTMWLPSQLLKAFSIVIVYFSVFRLIM